MIVTVNCTGYMCKNYLPDKVSGRYWLCSMNGGHRDNLVTVEETNGKWVAKSNRKTSIYDMNGNLLKTAGIYDGCVYRINQDNGPSALLYAKNISKEDSIFTHLVVPENTNITIGRSKNNLIIYDDEFVSGNHAVLVRTNGIWNISDLNSANGTYVNNALVRTATLRPGDVVNIMGLRIIVAGGFIAINNPNFAVHYNDRVLDALRGQEVLEHGETPDIPEEEYFYRSPRLERKIENFEIKVSSPGNPQNGDSMPLAMVIGPSMTMGVGSAATAVFSVINAVNRNASIMEIMPTVIMAVAMLGGMILWPIITKKSDERNKNKKEELRQGKYREYLMEVRDDIQREIKNQEDILNTNNLPLKECEDTIIQVKRTLWERATGQDGFLELRIGTGDADLNAKIQFPERTFSLDNDNLFDDVMALSKESRKLHNVPVVISLIENPVCGIIGDNMTDVINFVRSLLIRLVSTHSYDEVKIMVIVDEEQKGLDFLKWVPHIWDDDHTERYFANNENDVKALFSLIEKKLASFGQTESSGAGNGPSYVIINASKSLARKSETMRRLYEHGAEYRYYILEVDNGLLNLPKECSRIIEISADVSKVYDKSNYTGSCIEFLPDMNLSSDPVLLSKKLSNIHLNLKSGENSLPDMMTFLDMFHVGKIEYLNSLTRWKENNPIISLKTPIGVEPDGDLFYLDLHEKFQGPHGLVAGMTGSGKSEFIITYILSLAVNYHPDEVAFILIDYKGGGLAGAFEDKERGIKLPHLAGTITNLDGAAVKRSLISIQSELRRRQAIFNEARKVSGEGTIDIYKYQKLYREKRVKEPVPHLFIISDEFAELKAQQPDFMQQLISAARIGRSLGVHLILATQKPSGVVDEQIWSNSRFRICLKVQSKSDSMDMIKRPDAAELSNTGRFYLQVGYNEYFAIGQSAWCGAEYNPADEVATTKETTLQIVDNMGRVEKEIHKSKEKSRTTEKIKQVVGIVKYLSDLAQKENISVRPLWLDPIPDKIYLDDIIKKYEYKNNKPYILEAVVGVYDDAFNQSQDLIKVKFSELGNAILYGNGGSGKELFLNTLIYDLCCRYSPEYLNMYLMDFGSETLQMFSSAPHVGAVVLSSDEEKVIRLIRLLRTTIEKRKKILSKSGGTYELYYKVNTDPLPNTLVIVNNFAALNEMYDDLMDDFAYLTREGVKYGMYFLFTASATTEVKYRISQNCSQNILLQMNDPGDYMTVIGNTGGMYPSKIYGRGIVRSSNVYEFQTAYICDGDKTQEFVKKACDEWNAMYAGIEVPAVKTVPVNLTPDMMADTDYNLTNVPVGVNISNVETTYINLTDKPLYTIFANDYSKLVHVEDAIFVILNKISGIHVEKINEESPEDKIRNIYGLMVDRHNNYKDTGDNSDYEQHVYIIRHSDMLWDNLSDDGRGKMNAMFANCEPELNIHFIIFDNILSAVGYYNQLWFKTRFTPMTGIWFEDGYNDQSRYKTAIPIKTSREIKRGTAFVMSDGNYIISKMVSTKIQEETE